jgi:hypothetical protein
VVTLVNFITRKLSKKPPINRINFGMTLTVKEIDFSTIEQIWQHHLWSGRVSKIEPYSAMMFMHDRYEISFATRPSIFFGGYIDNKLVAVNSIHLAEAYLARSRGLWVSAEYRGNSFGTVMLKISNSKAKDLGADAIWSFSRQTSIRSYVNAGYFQVSSWMKHGEFGPNAYVMCPLRT